jgi:putative transposase
MHCKPYGTLKSATISRHAGNYYISLLYEVEKPTDLPISANMIGLDLGIKAFAVDSNGKVYDNPKFLQRSLDKLKIEQQKLSNMTKGSKNFAKQKLKIAKLHLHIANQRLDHAHKLASTLIKENQIICVEDLDIKSMLQKENADTKTRSKADNNKARAILDVGMGQFVTILKYKAEWYGRQLIQIDRYTPSSQMCNYCKSINPAIKDLNMREWICPQCGTAHDRDYNAAKNILEEGLKQATSKNKK